MSSTSSTPEAKQPYSPPYIVDGKTDAERYLEGCLDGSIVACKKIKKLAEIMLPRFHSEYHGFVFSEEAALRPVRFIERFCRIPSAENMGMPFIMEPYERMIVELAFGFVDKDGCREFREVLVEIARKNGKCCSVDTEVATPSGWRAIGDIHVGDLVYGQDGQAAYVIAESEIHYDKPTYLITFEDGAQVKATDDHIWTVQTRGSRRLTNYVPKSGRRNKASSKYREGGWYETTTQEMYDDQHFLHKRADGKGIEYKYRVPMCQPVEYPEKDLPIDPYTFGCWIGDGSSNGPEITVGLEDIDHNVDAFEKRGHTWTIRHDHDKTYTLRLDGQGSGRRNPFKDALSNLGVLNSKHIPDIYLQGSIEQRWELLRGLMDTDGYCSKAGQCEFTQKSELIVDQLIELCSSLGIKASKRSKYAWCGNEPCCTVYQAQFFTDKSHSCFNLKRKHDRLKDKLADRMTRKTIISIERIPNEPTKCIAIDNPSHLYLVGRQYTATHNTSLLAALNLYMLTSDNEPAAECYNGATNTQQARLCYGATNDMVKMSPLLKKRIRRGMVQKRGITGLNYDENSSYLCTISSKSDSLDGLNMHFGVLDELAACKDQGATYRLLTGAMSSRRQAMLFSISTQGKVRNNIWDNRLEVCNKWLNGETRSDRILPILFEQDSRQEVFAGLEEENRWLWKKSNPGLGTVKKESSMLEMVQQAFDNRADVPEVLMKQFNIPALEYESFLDYEDCVNDEPVPFDPSVDHYCCIGFDLASSGDLNAAVALYKRPGDDRIFERSCCWIADEQVNINIKGFKERDAVPYRQWASDGWLNIVEGDKVNQMVIIEWIRSLVDDGLYPMAVAYDGWHVDDWTERELKRLCGETRVHTIPQYAKVLSPLMKEHRLDLKARRVINDSPITHWARMNVEVSVDNNDNYMPRKKNLDAHKKIDPYLAELFAFKAYKLHEEEYVNMING